MSAGGEVLMMVRGHEGRREERDVGEDGKRMVEVVVGWRM